MKNSISNINAAKFLLSVNNDLFRNNHSEGDDVNGENVVAEFAMCGEFGDSVEWDAFSSEFEETVSYNRYEKGGFSIVVFSGNFDGSDHGFIVKGIPTIEEIKSFVSEEILNADLV